MDAKTLTELSPTQKKVASAIYRWSQPNGGTVQIAGYGRAHWLSAARALVRKNLAWTWRTGHYALTDEGKRIAKQVIAEQRATVANAFPEGFCPASMLDIEESE